MGAGGCAENQDKGACRLTNETVEKFHTRQKMVRGMIALVKNRLVDNGLRGAA